VQGQIVALDLEALGRQVLHVSRAAVDGKHTVAVIAMEVVVMMVGLPMAGLAERLVTGGLAWQIDAQHLAVLEQILQLSIDRREIQARDRALSKLADFLRRERSVAVGQRSQDGVALACLTFHVLIILQMRLHLQLIVS
jgi:hypothetical protein